MHGNEQLGLIALTGVQSAAHRLKRNLKPGKDPCAKNFAVKVVIKYSTTGQSIENRVGFGPMIGAEIPGRNVADGWFVGDTERRPTQRHRSEEHTSELQS